MDRQIERQTDRQMYRQTDIQIVGQKDEWRYRWQSQRWLTRQTVIGIYKVDLFFTN
jgi:hypothetical protein